MNRNQPSPDWVTALPGAETASQLLVVACVGDTTASVSLHERDGSGVWRQRLTTPGFIGRNGLGKEQEGDEKTPRGTFRFTHAFGVAADPGCAMPYHQVTETDYWSGDQRPGMRYNQPVRLEDCPDLDTKRSEHLIEYETSYQYCLNIGYNEAGVPGLGSALFLHCFGPTKPYTEGCVAIPRDKMRRVMELVRPDCVVVIDSLEALGAEL